MGSENEPLLTVENTSDSILFGKYEIGKLLGYGAFAKVYHARNVSTGQSVAIKVVSKHKVIKGNLAENVKREISVMRRLRHPHIVRLHEVLATKSKVYFVLEFAKGGELFAKIAKGRFSEDLSRRYFQQLISAVGFCHLNNVFHRDLKPENLLLDENWNLKITDFGLSAVSDPTRPDDLLHTLCGTPAYVAPEILAKKGYNGAKVDIWSCGIILFVLISGYLPFNDPNLMVMYRKIYKGEFRCPKWISPDLKRFLFRLLDTNPETRITIAEINIDPWFQKGYREVKLLGENMKENSGKQLNAFDIISFSSGVNLSGLFDSVIEERFVSDESPEKIIGVIAKGVEGYNGKFVVTKEKHVGVRIVGQDGNLAVGVGINRLTDKLVVVEIKRRENGGIWKDKLRELVGGLVYQPGRQVVGN